VCKTGEKMNKAQMEKLMADHELKILRLVNNISFDFTFLYDHSDDTGYIIRQDEGGKNPSHFESSFREELLKRVHPDDLLVLEKELKHAGQAVPQLAFELRIKEENGRRYRWHAIRMILLEEEPGEVYVGRTVYIDSRKHKETELTIKARQDPLTGLLNKVVSKEIIDNYIKHNPDSECALLVFDIDKFKNFNDTMGHLFGDEVIKECANCLRRAFSKDSFVGRIGGDEFVVFIKDLSDISNIVQRMGKIRDALSTITLGQRTNIGITCSVGISLYPDMGNDYESLFQCADMALYSVKSRGRNNYAFYTDEIFDESVLERREEKEESDDETSQPGSLFDMAVRLLREAENVSSAINLVLYRIQNDYDLEAIHLHEFDPKTMSVVCNYEIHKPERESYLGKRIEFSYKAWKKINDESALNGGYILFDYADKNCLDSGSDVKSWDGVLSMLHVDLILFGKNRGCIDFVSSHAKRTWTLEKIDELVKLCNLICVCMYYSSKVARAERAVSKFTEFDSLTGLMKEEAFIEAATKAISSKANEKKLAVIYCDISNFKYINEAYGYVVGDRILTDMANYISNNIKNVLCAGRFYSDNILFIEEFENDIPDDCLVKNVEAEGEKLSNHLSTRFNVNNLSVRTGIYIIPSSNTDALLSISNANMARKLAKASKGARCILFNQEMFEKRKRQIEYIQKIDDAIKNEEFYIVLQPKVSGTHNRLEGAEALARWKMKDGREIYPDEFVPAFEKDGSIVKLDFYVYEKVMAYIRKRLDENKKVLPISMNVSRAHMFSDDFVEKFRKLIEKYQVPTQYLELEITESIYLENMSSFNSMIEELRMLGIKISMDDFGSGYSSLNVLNDLKIDLLKIDKIFMKDETLKESDKTIIRFIIDMAKQLSVRVLCEGVETQSQRSFLNEAGCELHQGYLYSKPVTISLFDEYLDNEDALFARVC